MRTVTKTMQTLAFMLIAMFAFSLSVSAQSTLITESFENGGSVPAGWAVEQVSGTCPTQFASTSSWPSGFTAYQGTWMAAFRSFSYSTGVSRLKQTTPFSTVGYTNVAIDFAWLESTGYSGSADKVDVQWSTNGTTWNTAATFLRYNAVQGWKIKNVNLPAGAQGQATLYIAFQFTSAYGNDCYLDLAHVTAVGPPPPVTVTLGTGTTTQGYPYYTFYMDSRTQMLYTAAEITAAGGGAGEISWIAFNVSSYATQTMNGFKIRMKNTTQTTISTWDNDMTTVFDGTYAVPGTGWQQITLQTPFVWDGSNLLVEVCFNNTSYTSNSYVRTTYLPNQNYHAHFDGSSTDGCTTANSGASYVSYRANMRMFLTPWVGTLSGTVTNCFNNTPLAGATVTAGTLTATTNATGNYIIYNVPVGNYAIQCTAPGFINQTKPAVINNQQTTTVNFCMEPIPAYLSGIVTNSANGNPIVGALVMAQNGSSTYSVAGGAYTLNIYPVGNFTVTASKTGFDNFTAGPFNFQQGVTTTLDIPMLENVNPPVNVVAALNTPETAVDINWGLPLGNYEILYDDGIADNFTVWAVQGNMNAVKFTPIGYPATVYGGKVNIGTIDDYPAGANPLVPFQMAIYDATGPGGMPGQPIGEPIDVSPTTYGWINFTFPNPAMIASGNFYLVMIQGGNAPNAAGIAVDETSPQLRSYARFVTGGAPWIPASGNFLMRALMNGTGGPIPTDGMDNIITAGAVEGAIYAHTPATVSGTEGIGEIIPVAGDNGDMITGYQVWRLKQGEETNPGLWTSIGTPATTSISDNSWPSLACGPYRWAVKAAYTGNRFSAAAFSNVIGKCNTAEVTVNVLLTCAAHPLEGTQVQLINTVYPDTAYYGFTDTNGTVVFPTVWKGNYDLNVIRFTYPFTTQNIDVIGDMTIDMMLLQDKTPPSNLFVDDRSLESIWNSPKVAIEQFAETWDGGYTPNQWVETPATSNWSITTTFGNPSPSAMFNWTPTVTNYEQFLTSNKVIGTVYAPSLTFKYDIYLSNFSNTTVENLAVEVYDGTWHTVKNWSNANGSIAWTTDNVDISAYAQSDIKIRFKAWGADSYQINNWNVDNIYIVAGDGGSGYNPCVIGYNFYLNSVQVAFTTDTTYLIPANLVAYGQTYNACVNAVYGSGYSAMDCYTFTSHFLYPPTNLQVEGVECAAYLTWDKPAMIADVRVTDIQPRTYAPIASAEYSPFEITLEGQDYTDNIWDILFSWTGTDAARPGIEASIDKVYLSAWQSGFGAPPWFQEYDKATGSLVTGFDIPGATAIRDMAYDGQYYYGSPASSTIYQMDFTAHTLVSSWSTGASSGIRHCAYDPNLDGGNGGFWAGNWTDLKAIKFDGTLIWNGPAPNNAYGSAFDNQSPGGPYLWLYTQTGASLADISQFTIGYSPMSLTATGVTFNVGTVPGYAGGASAGGLCASPVGTKYALIANAQQDPQFVVGLEIADYSGPGGDPPGLIGYKIYRDGNYLAYVSGKDTTWYYDFTVDPGTHTYAVTAWYDLTDYGFPGMFDESLIDGPESISIICGRDLPFCETWDQGSFAYNEWTFGPDQGNWTVSTGTGDPAPAADFGWVPITADYSNAMVSPTLNAGPWNCATLWLDFDYKLVDRNATGHEYLTVEAYWSGVWHEVAEYANNGDVNWTGEHIDISGAGGKAVKVRFTAHGDNTEDILHWYVDNICVYGICNAPVDLEVTYQSQNNVTLSWTAPECTSGGGGTVMEFIFDDGTAENGWAINPGFLAWMGTEFPIDPSFSGVIQSVDVWFGWGASAPGLTVDIFDGSQNLVGSSATFTTPNEDWLNIAIPDVPFNGPFYAMVKWDMLGAGTNFFGYDENGPYASTNLAWYYDGTAWDHMSSVAGTVPGVFMIRATALVGGDAQQVMLVPGKQPIGTIDLPQGVLAQSSQSFDTKNYKTMGVVDNSDSALIMGYNVYRSFESDPYEMLNTTPVAGTTYDDVIPLTHNYGDFHYYVTAVYNDAETNSFLCESPESNIVDISWPAVGINELNSGSVSVYPNPASEIVNIKSDYTINQIDVMNFLGQSVYTQSGVDAKTTKINVSNLQAGVYFVKVTTAQGVRAVKITVTK